VAEDLGIPRKDWDLTVMSTAAKPTKTRAMGTRAVVRPLSPHLQVYRMPLAALLSIAGHRATGIGLASGLSLLTWWLVAAAYGDASYGVVMAFIGSWFGQLILFGFTLAFYFHVCTGVRHLFWDAGKGFEISDTQRTNQIVIAASVGLTIITWLIV
jgi:succinate dehydrogenase / fumarate reductase, cytochrome b subunit